MIEVISTIRKNRIAEYQHILDSRPDDRTRSKAPDFYPYGTTATSPRRLRRSWCRSYGKRVYPQLGSVGDAQQEFGFIIDRGPDYCGEAGHSSRVWVLWSDGKRTLCTSKGMKGFKDADGNKALRIRN